MSVSHVSDVGPSAATPAGWWQPTVVVGAAAVAAGLAGAAVMEPGPLRAGHGWVAVPAVAAWLLWHWGLRLRRARPSSRPADAVYLGGALALWVVTLAVDHAFMFLALPLYLVVFLDFHRRRIAPGAVAVTAALLIGELLGGHSPAGALALSVGTGVMATAILVPIRAVIEQNHAKQELIAQLRAAREELAEAEREAGARAERERLARDLHDSIAQSFSSVIMLLEASQAPGGGQLSDRTVEQTLTVAREALAEVRRAVWALRPHALEDAPLVTALRRLVQRHGAETDVEVSLEVIGAPRHLATDAEVTILRVAQEALANTRHHAEAAHVSLQLRYQEDRVVLAVADDGIGFDHDALPADRAGVGLRGMQERAGALEGELTVSSQPGAGARITLAIPAAATPALDDALATQDA